MLFLVRDSRDDSLKRFTISEYNRFITTYNLEKSKMRKTCKKLYEGNDGRNWHKGFRLEDIIDENLEQELEKSSRLGVDTPESMKIQEGIDNLIEKQSTIFEGKTERKPKYEKINEVYHIYYGGDKVVKITEDELSRFKKLYCGRHGITIEQLGLEFNLLREETFAIKTAFDIVKQSIPYTDAEIDTMSVDEMAEETRIHKKKAYFKRLDELKIKDMEEEIKKLHQKDYYFNKFMKEINISKIDFEYFKDYTPSNRKNSFVLALSDWHIGAKVDNLYNKYNKRIATYRIDTMICEVLNNIDIYKPEHIYIVNLGDIINGLIHTSNRANSDMNVFESINFAIDSLCRIINTLSKYTPVTFTSVIGNHSRLFSNKTDSINDENFENLILWTLYRLYCNNDRVKILLGDVITSEFNVYNKKILCHHGDFIQNESRTMNNRKNIYEIILKGHWHNFDIKTICDTEVITVGSLMGSDEYASSKELYSKPSQLLIIIDEVWNRTYLPIYLDSMEV